jgi:hypothetical protein
MDQPQIQGCHARIHCHHGRIRRRWQREHVRAGQVRRVGSVARRMARRCGGLLARGQRGVGGDLRGQMASTAPLLLTPSLLLSSSSGNVGVGCQRLVGNGGGGVRVAAWEAELPRQFPPAPSSLLSDGTEVYGVDDKSTTVMSGSGVVVADARVVGSAAG